MFSFLEKNVLVTGATAGLGLAYAEALAARGANVVLNARSSESLQHIALSLRKRHAVRIEAIAVDVSRPAAAEQIARELKRIGMPIDLLINNAGVGFSGMFTTHLLESELMQVQLNICGMVSMTHHFARTMVDAGHGGIINVASNAAFQPVPYMATYGGTKAFVLLFTEALREELRGTGVQIMVACPGPTATNFFSLGSCRMRAKDMDSVDHVADRTLDDFASGKSISYPGKFKVRLATWAARLLPRSVVARISGSSSQKMGFAN